MISMTGSVIFTIQPAVPLFFLDISKMYCMKLFSGSKLILNSSRSVTLEISSTYYRLLWNNSKSFSVLIDFNFSSLHLITSRELFTKKSSRVYTKTIL